jgi:hypothetical protein
VPKFAPHYRFEMHCGASGIGSIGRDPSNELRRITPGSCQTLQRRPVPIRLERLHFGRRTVCRIDSRPRPGIAIRPRGLRAGKPHKRRKLPNRPASRSPFPWMRHGIARSSFSGRAAGAHPLEHNFAVRRCHAQHLLATSGKAT